MNKNTQEKFYKFLTIKKLNELLHRVDSSTRFLENQINIQLNGFYCKSNVYVNNINEYSIYIHFFNQLNQQIGHLTMHLYPDNPSKSNAKNGRIHIKNNRNSKTLKYPIRFNRVNGNIRLSITTPLIMKDDLRYCSDATIAILNTYFLPLSENYLSKPKTQYQRTHHRFLNNILSQMAISQTSSIRNTRKRSYT